MSVQGELFDTPALTHDQLRAYLNERATRPVIVSLNRNRVTMASVDLAGYGPVRVRLHETFLTAPHEVLSALRAYIRTRHAGHWDVVAEYAREIPADARKPQAQHRLRTCGEVHDLNEIIRDVNTTFFSNRVTCRIGWGRRRGPGQRRTRTRSIRFGSWDPGTRIVRIHPLLDDSRVPREFVRYIVYHEMLHAVVPADKKAGRRIDHGATFKQFESAYPRYEEMQQMVKQITRLLL